jgi:hypothetical protein
MRPNEIMTLIGLWRLQVGGGEPVFADEVAREVSDTAERSFGVQRTEGCIRRLSGHKLVKKGGFGDQSVVLTRAGWRFCEALESMGLKDEF